MSVPVRPLTIESAVDELLSSIDSDGCGTEVATALRQKAAQLLRQVRPHSPRLTSQQRRYLVESGDFTPEEFAETEERVARGELREMEQRTSLDTIAASYGESEVAALLEIPREEVRSLHSEGKLYAFDAAGVTVYPRWQFTDETPDGLLPHLAHLLESFLPDERHPASVQGFMTVPKDDLSLHGEWQSPVQWLLRGASPDVIDDILEGERWR